MSQPPTRLYGKINVWRSTGTKEGWWAVCMDYNCRGRGSVTTSGVLPSKEACGVWAKNHMRVLHWGELSRMAGSPHD